MANQEQLEILKQGVKLWNSWREENPDAEIDLKEAYLHQAHLRKANLNGASLNRAYLGATDFWGADLSGAELHGAILRGAILRGASLNDAHLSKADLWGASLREASLSGADLSGADLSEAIFIGANLKWANLTDADLSRARLSQTLLAYNDLSNTRGLEAVIHDGPSIIDAETIRLSKGKIPEAFLRGCGLSDVQIAAAKLAAPGLDPEQVTNITYTIYQLYVGSGIQYYSCFISYSSKDEEFAKLLHEGLQDHGVRCWFAPEDMKIGDQIRPTIDQQIRKRDKLLVILSEDSVKSEWVGDEVEGALEEEHKSNRLVLFPIRLDDAVMNARDDWAAKVRRRRHIGDFSNWVDKASYQKAFERLLRDLKAPDVTPGTDRRSVGHGSLTPPIF